MKLVADRLAGARGGRTLFTGLSFAVEGGEALLLMGPNGAGKTTLIRMIVGLLAPAAGRIGLEGGDAELSLGEQCHYVGHLNAVKSSLTVEENAAFWCRFLGAPDASDRIEPALASFGLAELRDMPAAYLSAGQRRRLGLARVLWPSARSGCSTSRPSRSTGPPRTCSASPSTSMSPPAAWWWRRRMCRSASPSRGSCISAARREPA